MATRSGKNLQNLTTQLLEARKEIQLLNAEFSKLVDEGKSVVEIQATLGTRISNVKKGYLDAQQAVEQYTKANSGNAKSNKTLQEGIRALATTLNATKGAYNSLNTTVSSTTSNAISLSKKRTDEVTKSNQKESNSYEEIRQEILGLMRIIEVEANKDKKILEQKDARRRKSINARKRFAKQQEDLINREIKAEEKAQAAAKKRGDFFGGVAEAFSPNAIGRAIGSVTKFVSIYSLLTGAVDAVRNAIVGSVKAFADFESRIQRLSAVSNASTQELNVLSESIRNTALQTAFGVQEISDLAISLAKLGVAAKDIPDLLTPVALAAQATGESLDQTGEAIVKVINQFGLSTEQTIVVASTLTSAINSSTLSLDQFGTAIGYVGPLATQVGLSFEETASYLSVLADNGFSASRAGTGLRKIFLDLKQPGEDISQTLQRLADRNLGLAEAEQLVGKTAAAQLVVLLRNLDATKQQISASEGLTDILIQNARANSTLIGQYNILTNTIEDFQIAIGDAITNSEFLLDVIGSLSKESERLARGYKLLNELNKELGNSFRTDLAEQIEKGNNAIAFFIRTLERSSDEKLRKIGKALRDADPKNIQDVEKALNSIIVSENKLGAYAKTFGSIFGSKTAKALGELTDSLFGVEEQAKATAGAFGIILDAEKEFADAKAIQDANDNVSKSLDLRLDRLKKVTNATQQFNEAIDESKRANAEIEQREKAIAAISLVNTDIAQERILRLKGEIQAYKTYKQTLSEYLDPAGLASKLDKEAADNAKNIESALKARAARLKEEIRLIEARRKAEEKAAAETKKLGLDATKGDPAARAKVLADYDNAIAQANANASASLVMLSKDFGDFARDSQDAFTKLSVAFPSIAESIIDSTYDINDAIAELGADIEFTFSEQIVSAVSNAESVFDSYGESIDEIQGKFKKDKKNREKYIELIEEEAKKTIELLETQKAGIDQTTADGKFGAMIIDGLIAKVKSNVVNLKKDLEGDDKIDWKKILAEGLQEAIDVVAEAINRFNDVAFENTKNRLEAQRAAIQAEADIENDILKSQLDNQLITEEEFRNRSEANRKKEIARQNAIDQQIFEAEKKRDKQNALSEYLQALASIIPNLILNDGEANPIALLIKSAITGGLATASYASKVSAINKREFYPTRFAEGGMVEGPSHAEGGIPFTVQGRGGYEMEGGEFIVNKRAASLHRSLLERINSSAKTSPLSGSFAYDSINRIPSKFAQGGSVSPAQADQLTQEQLSYLRAIAEATTSTAVGVSKPVRAFITQTDLRNNDLERRIVNKNSRL